MYNPLQKDVFESIDFDKEFSEVSNLDQAKTLLERVKNEDKIKDTNHLENPLYDSLLRKKQEYLEKEAEEQTIELSKFNAEELTVLIALLTNKGKNISQHTAALEQLQGYKVAENVDEFFKPTNISRILKDNTTPESMQAQIDLAKSLGASETRYQVLTEQKELLEANVKQFDKWPKDLGSIDSEADRQAAQSKLFKSYGVQDLSELLSDFPAAHDSWIKIIESSKKEETKQENIDASKRTYEEEYLLEAINNGVDKLTAREELKKIQEADALNSLQKYVSKYGTTKNGYNASIIIATNSGQTDIVNNLIKLRDKIVDEETQEKSPLDQALQALQNTPEFKALPPEERLLEQSKVANKWEALTKEPEIKDFTYYANKLLADGSNFPVIRSMMEADGNRVFISGLKQAVQEMKQNEDQYWKDPAKVTKSNYLGAILAAEQAGFHNIASTIEAQFGEDNILDDPTKWTKKNIGGVLIAASALPLETDNLEDLERRERILEQVNAYLDDPRNMSKDEANLARLGMLGISDEDALKFVTGAVKYMRDPVDGTFYKINEASGDVEVLYLGVDPENPATNLNEIGISSDGSTTINNEFFPNPESTIPESASFKGAFGVGGWVRKGWNKVKDAFGSSNVNRGYIEAESALQTLQVQVLTNLQSALPGKESKFLAQKFEGLAPEAGLLSLGPAAAKAKITQLSSIINEMNDYVIDQLDSVKMKPLERSNVEKVLKQLQQVQVNYEDILSRMERGSSGGVGSFEVETNETTDDLNNTGSVRALTEEEISNSPKAQELLRNNPGKTLYINTETKKYYFR